MIKIFEMGKIRDEEIFARFEPTSSVEDIVKGIIARVRAEGDAALRAYSAEFDHVDIEDFLVSAAEIEAALAKVEPEFIAVLEEAATNIRAFHSKQVRNSFILADKPGVILGQRVIPLEKVGLYVPGGTAAYPSTVLMDAIPAKIAGVEEIVMVTPPNKEGSVNPYILAAAHVAGVGRIFKVGGAQAVAALAYGTASIPRVDKIVGPGNAFVAEAKKQVFGQVGIDMIAGPSEVLVLADGKSDPRFVAADLLSQAEHDKNASAVLITDSMALAEAVQQELEVQLAQLRREHLQKLRAADVLDLLVGGLDVGIIILHRRGQVARQDLGSVMKQRGHRAALRLRRQAEDVPADERQRMGKHRDHVAVLLHVFGKGVAHERPARDVAHPRDVGKKVAFHVSSGSPHRPSPSTAVMRTFCTVLCNPFIPTVTGI